MILNVQVRLMSKRNKETRDWYYGLEVIGLPTASGHPVILTLPENEYPGNDTIVKWANKVEADHAEGMLHHFGITVPRR